MIKKQLKTKHHNLVIFCIWQVIFFFFLRLKPYSLNKKVGRIFLHKMMENCQMKTQHTTSYTKTSQQEFIQTRGYLVDFLILAGMWRVSLEPVEAGGPYSVTAASHNETVTLTDVLFGDVWLCGGQSNMEFPTSRVCQRGFFCYYKQVQSEKSGLYHFIFVKKKSSLLDF